DGTVPGPELRVRQGDPLRLVVNNKLGEDTTVHWPRYSPAKCDGWGARPHAEADPSRRELFLRVHAARCWHLLVSPTCRHAATDWPRACWRIDRRGTRTGCGRSRPPVVHRRLAAGRNWTDHTRLRQSRGSRNVWSYRQYRHGKW